jgi:hypothetical protein
MGEKSKGSVNKKKPAAKSLKEKRAAKQEEVKKAPVPEKKRDIKEE